MQLEQLLDEWFVRSERDFNNALNEPDFNLALFEWWQANGDMPYGVQKARDGDPDQWMYDATCQAMRWE